MMGVGQSALRFPAASSTEIAVIVSDPVCVNGPTVAVNVDPAPLSLMMAGTPLTTTVA